MDKTLAKAIRKHKRKLERLRKLREIVEVLDQRRRDRLTGK